MTAVIFAAGVALVAALCLLVRALSRAWSLVKFGLNAQRVVGHWRRKVDDLESRLVVTKRDSDAWQSQYYYAERELRAMREARGEKRGQAQRRSQESQQRPPST